MDPQAFPGVALHGIIPEIVNYRLFWNSEINTHNWTHFTNFKLLSLKYSKLGWSVLAQPCTPVVVKMAALIYRIDERPRRWSRCRWGWTWTTSWCRRWTTCCRRGRRARRRSRTRRARPRPECRWGTRTEDTHKQHQKWSQLIMSFTLHLYICAALSFVQAL